MNIAEDFAESVRVYFEDNENLRENYPMRYKVIRRMLEDEDYGG